MEVKLNNEGVIPQSSVLLSITPVGHIKLMTKGIKATKGEKKAKEWNKSDVMFLKFVNFH